MRNHKLGFGFTLLLVVALAVAGCSTGAAGEDKKVTLAYVAWDSEIASTHVVEYVLENKLGYEVELLQVDAGPMWAGVSDGSADAMVAAWLPSTHESYYAENEGKFVDVGPNLDGTKIGLVVPAYMNINSIEDLKTAEAAEAVNSTIIGIEPGAGLMMATQEGLTTYDLEGWTLLESSSAAMAAELQSAYAEQKPIIVTGWTPHWKFGKMDLKYLEDPQGIYGGAEQIHTIVRKGLDKDQPAAYKLLDQFTWTPADMAEVMVAIQDGAEPAEAAKAWADAHPDQVNAWISGIEK
jgi:ABC-type proline/glycine betaine transport system substrate-binding protein